MEKKEQKQSNSKNYKEYLFYFAILAILLIGFFSFRENGYSLVVIVNEDLNSMYPTYYQGDIFVIQQKPATDIQIGDVVVYKNEVSGGTLIIHRVIEIIPIEINGEIHYYYRVKGDNPVDNSIPDNTKYSGGVISYEMIKGVVVRRIAWFGTISLVKSDTTNNGFLIYASLVIGILALLFWPEKEEEKKKPRLTLEKTKQYVVNFLRPKTNKKKILTLFYAFLVLIVFIFSLWTVGNTSFISSGRIVQVSASQPISYTSNVEGHQISRHYVQLSVEIEINKAPNKAMIMVLTKANDGAEISEMTWRTLRPILGRVTIGIGIVYDISIPTSSVSFVIYLYLQKGSHYVLVQSMNV